MFTLLKEEKSVPYCAVVTKQALERAAINSFPLSKKMCNWGQTQDGGREEKCSIVQMTLVKLNKPFQEPIEQLHCCFSAFDSFEDSSVQLCTPAVVRAAVLLHRHRLEHQAVPAG